MFMRKRKLSCGIVMRKNQTSQPPTSDSYKSGEFCNKIEAGKPLQSNVRGKMESALGSDLSSVRIHTGAKAARLSRQLHARAFAIGNDVAFADTEYRPGTLVGDAIIAHELAHVVQQRNATVSTGSPKVGADQGALESDANHTAIAVVSQWHSAPGNRISSARPSLRSGLRLQRCTDEQKEQAKAGFKAAVTGLASGRRQPIPIPFPDPDAARGALDLQYGINREDFVLWQAGQGHSPKWESFYGTNFIDWSHYLQFGDSFGQIWPHFLHDVWKGSVPREAGGSTPQSERQQ